MIYPIDRNNRIPSIKSALQTAAVITTVFYETVNYLIFSTPRSNKVIKLQDNGNISFGDSWTSTTTITNEFILQQSIDPYDWAIIVTPDILAFVAKNASGATGDCFAIIFGKSADAAKNLVSGTCSSSNSGYRYSCWDTTGAAVQLKPVIYCTNEVAIDSSGYYYAFDYYLKTLNGNTVSASPLKGVKVVLNGILSTSQGYQKFGNDVVVNGRYANYNAAIEMGANLVITNGVI